jgi:hypothetical protein
MSIEPPLPRRDSRCLRGFKQGWRREPQETSGRHHVGGGSSWALGPLWRLGRELQVALAGVPHLPRPIQPDVALNSSTFVTRARTDINGSP